MIEVFNDVLRRFYGCNTKVTSKVERLPKQRISEIYEALYLWRNDPFGEQVKTLEDWTSASFWRPMPIYL
jgi:hypothetical protein